MNTRARSNAGFTLIEMVCVMAMIGLIVAILLPRIPHETSRARLEAYAVEVAAMLKEDRNAAIRRRTQILTAIDADARSMRSGASGRRLRLPDDVRFDALLPERCNDRPAFSSISFFASGMSCGGVIALTHRNAGFEIRVNWLTGSIELVANRDV